MTSGATQAHTFLATAGSADLFVLDLEGNGHGTPMSQAQAREFIATVKGAGHKCGLYHSASGYPRLGQDWDWIADYRAGVPHTTPGTMHQYRGSPLDLDRFNGDLVALRKLAGKAAPPPPAWYHLAFTGGAFWVYDVAKNGHIVQGMHGPKDSGRHAHTFTAPTGAPCGPLLHRPWDGHGSRWVAQVKAGLLKGSWIGVPQPHVRYEVVR
jgi:hypothetical protein